MKKIIIFSIIVTIIACVLIAGCTNTVSKPPLQITYYYSPACSITDCMATDVDFKKLEQNYHGEFIITKYNVDMEFVRFRDDLNKYGKDSVTPFIIVGNKTYSGYDKSIYYDIEYMIKNR